MSNSSDSEIYMCKESAVVPYPDADGNEVPTLITKNRHTARKGSKMLEMFGEFFEPVKVDYDVDTVAESNEDKGKPPTAPRKVAAAARKAAKATGSKTVEAQVKANTGSAAAGGKPPKAEVPTPPAGHVGNEDPAGEGGPDAGVAKGAEADPLHPEDPKLG